MALSAASLLVVPVDLLGGREGGVSDLSSLDVFTSWLCLTLPAPSYPPGGHAGVAAASVPPTIVVQRRGRRPRPRLPGLGDPCGVILAVPAHLCVIVVSCTFITYKASPPISKL